MAKHEVVGYEYIAVALGVKTQTVRVYKTRWPDDFPKAIDDRAQVKLVPRRDADRFIRKYRAAGKPETTPPAHLIIDLDKVVGLDYIAMHLNISLKTARTYAADTPQRPEGFPTPINTWTPHADPLYLQRDADIFIATRLIGSRRRRGRLNATPATPDALAAAAEVNRLLGREINLENRKQLQEALFGDRGLPATELTARGPSVSTVALLALYAQHPDPVLQQVLAYRGVVTPEPTS